MTDPWEVKEFLDRTTGRVERIYTYKRKPCKRVTLESRLARQLAGYTLIDKDLRCAAIWMQEIKKRHHAKPTHKGHTFGHSTDRETYNLIKGFFVAALTFYGKCFTSCEGRKVKLEKIQLDTKFHEIHGEAMSFRHNFAAHSGGAELEKCEVALVFPKKPRPSVSPKIYLELWQPDLAESASGRPTFEELIEHARLVAERKSDQLTAI